MALLTLDFLPHLSCTLFKKQITSTNHHKQLGISIKKWTCKGWNITPHIKPVCEIGTAIPMTVTTVYC